MSSETSSTLRPSKPKRIYTKEQLQSYAARKKLRRETDPDVKKQEQERATKRKYGLTLEERDALLETQGFLCAVCATDAPDNGWVIDHCHSTNEVRGILCHPCNKMLGFARDNPDTLLKAVTYLGKQHG